MVPLEPEKLYLLVSTGSNIFNVGIRHDNVISRFDTPEEVKNYIKKHPKLPGKSRYSVFLKVKL